MEAKHNQNLNRFPGCGTSPSIYQQLVHHLVSSPDWYALSDGYKKAIKWCETMGTFHTTKNSENFETETNGTDFLFCECFQKLLNFWKDHSTENFRNSGRKSQMEWKFPVRNFWKVWYTTQVVWLSRNSRKCCSIYYWKLHGKQTIFQWIESAHNFWVIYIIL